IKYAPESLRKHGFKPPKREEVCAINVGKLDEQIDSLLDNKQAEKIKRGIKVYLNRLGYHKLLGKGQVTHPLIVQVKFCSKSAAEKIEKAGGKILGIKQ
ncbi:MAG: uL15m family ribosomal protein, partial [Candidatus Bathyarchaeia archaeon]